jgi:hypothetical protein
VVEQLAEELDAVHKDQSQPLVQLLVPVAEIVLKLVVEVEVDIAITRIEELIEAKWIVFLLWLFEENGRLWKRSIYHSY